jgi:hypothetical protein
MTSNSVHKYIQKFASEPVSMTRFKNMLKRTSENNPMFIKWRTAVIPTHASAHTMYWGRYYSNSDQSVTKEEEGMVNLVAPDTSEGWRTLTYDNISSFVFEGKRYVIY